MTSYTFSVLDDPQASSVAGAGTWALFINNDDVISGGIALNSNFTNVFIYKNGVYTSLGDNFQATAIGIEQTNDSGEALGYFKNGAGTDFGFTYENGNYTTLSDPSANSDGTFPADLNNSGVVVGYFSTGPTGGAVGETNYGFVYENGAYSTIADPLAVSSTVAYGINDAGEIVGSYVGDDDVHGFSYVGGVYTTIDDPTPGATGTNAILINNSGEIAGNFKDAAGHFTGFTYLDGVYTTISDPKGINRTGVDGLNNEGELVGTYTDARNRVHGFSYTAGQFTTIDPLGSTQTDIRGVNDSGEIVGSYTDANGVEHGFIAEPICFCAGARILTARGEIPVERLRVGDMAMALRQAGLAPVRWIGHARATPSRHAVPAHVHPVRIQAGAFGEGLPHSDLWLTPGHRIFVDGRLVQIDALLNDATIAQVESETFDVWHVELDRHDVLFANGLPVESFLDVGNRGALAGTNIAPLRRDLLAQGDESRVCAPMLCDQAALADLRSRLARQAQTLGWSLTEDPELRVADGGTTFFPDVENGRFVFQLPQRAFGARLRSRTRTPSRMEPRVEDARRLGVAVARLVVDGEPTPLDALVHGWRPLERDAAGEFRWMDGDAELPRGRKFEVEIVHPRRYWRCEERKRPPSANAAA